MRKRLGRWFLSLIGIETKKMKALRIEREIQEELKIKNIKTLVAQADQIFKSFPQDIQNPLK